MNAAIGTRLPIEDAPALVCNRGQSGKHVLVLSLSGFDPTRTLQGAWIVSSPSRIASGKRNHPGGPPSTETFATKSAKGGHSQARDGALLCPAHPARPTLLRAEVQPSHSIGSHSDARWRFDHSGRPAFRKPSSSRARSSG